MSSTDVVIAALNDLLSAEQRNLAPRLVQADVFVSGMSVRASDVVRRMAETMRRNGEQLVELIFDLGGEPRPRPCDVSTAHLHYQELSYVLPDLIRAHEKLIRHYVDARSKVAGNTRATELVNRILNQHEHDLLSLKDLWPSPMVSAG